MHFRNNLRSSAAVALIVLTGLSAHAQTAPVAPAAPVATAGAPAPGASATTGALRGRAVDSTNAVIPGVTVTLSSTSGQSFTTTSTGDGAYLIPNVTPGTYTVTTQVTGFSPYTRSNVVITAATATRVTLHLQPAVTATVTVTADNTQQLSVASDANASTLTLTGKDLDALSDDPDELSDELNALAGPAAGPNGGQIYIDGFTGGTLPPKSSIREIRINQNPFSAQYDKVGFGRIEVFTKPGTDKLHGQITLQGGDNNFNTAALVGGVYQPPYHSFFFQESLTGPLSKKASYSVASNYRVIQDNNVVNTYILGAANAPTPFFQSVSFPQNRAEVSPRLDLQITPTNTLTARYQFEHNSTTNGGIGGNSLATAGYNSTETDNEIQLSDSQIFGSHVISETRFEYEHDASSTIAQNPLLTTSIQGAFSNYGAGTGVQSDTSNHWELQSYTSVALSNHFIRFGGRMRINQDDNNSTAGHAGTFTYGQVTVNSTGAALLPSVGCVSQTTVSGICNYAIIQQYGTSAYAYGYGPTQFNATYGNPVLSASLADVGLYVEDDWKIRPTFTLSAGLRYETQNRIGDHHDFAPRLSAAWGLLPRNGAPLFVLRGGFGIFYDRFGLGSWENIQRYNGSATAEQQLTVANPAAACQDVNTCLAAYPGTATQVQYSQAPNLRTPYTIQSSASLEHQMTKSWTMTATYLNSRGKHQFFSQNLKATGASTGNNYQYVSEGVFKQNQLILQSRYSGPWGTSLFGFYVLGHANGDTSGSGTFPSQPGNILADYGRTGFDTRQRLFFGGSAQLPWYITLSPFMIVNSGQPFNITVGQDINGDNIYNDRPAFCSAATTAANTVNSKYGCFDKGTTLSQSRIPNNYAQGPAQFTFNLRATKTFGFGPLTAKGAAAAQSKKSQQAGPNGPPPGGGPGGGGHGGHGGGGMGFGGGGASTGHKYNLTIGAQGMNIFNVVNYSTPIGVLSSPQFGQQTRLAGNIFSSNTAVRRVMLQASFTF
ncbi:MAG: carboxypeptidase regulatory-like domain-containing protein [Acidobacteriaceae bacterium]|nr:carboxypeptidase regulatory-like domain-containing protein [Acidobacteriaceae bacterium]